MARHLRHRSEHFYRHWVVGHILPAQIQLEVIGIKAHAPGLKACQILYGCVRIHQHHHRRAGLARNIAGAAAADCVPSGQPLNVRRKQILAANRDAHAEQGAHEHHVGRLAAGPICRTNLDREVVYNFAQILAGKNVHHLRLNHAHVLRSRLK